jgi:hypothetical protein
VIAHSFPSKLSCAFSHRSFLRPRYLISSPDDLGNEQGRTTAMARVYKEIPQLRQWQTDTDFIHAPRFHDQELLRIDQFLGEYHRAEMQHGSRCGFVLCDLFLALNAWIKHFNERCVEQKNDGAAKSGKSAPPSAHDISKKRYPAVLELLQIVAMTLGKYQITKEEDEENSSGRIATLRHASSPSASHSDFYKHITKTIMGMTTVGIKPTGLDTDKSCNMKPFTDDQLAQFRMCFKGGLAWQVAWWEVTPTLDLQPADSSRAFNAKGVGTCMKDFGAFVMTKDLEIYMSKHCISKGIFHSSYTNQSPVVMAGTMLIKHGVVRAVRSDSGHYQPNTQEFRRFLRQLGALGVCLSRVDVFSHEDEGRNYLGKASDVLNGKIMKPAPVEDGEPVVDTPYGADASEEETV